MKRYSKTPRKLRRAAFTLLEVLLVLAILGVIAAMVIPNLLGSQQEAMRKATLQNIKGFESAVKIYAVNHDGMFPEGNAETVVQMLLSNQDPETGEAQQPLLTAIPLDAWKQPLMYEYPATGDKLTVSGKPAIWSLGPDKQDGTEDDINNWEADQKGL